MADEKNCARIKREMENTKEQMASTTTEFNRVANIHRAVKDKLEAQEKKIRDYEEQLRSTVAQLHKQIKDEIHSRTVIQTRIKTDTVDLSKNKEDAEKKKKQMKQMVKEIQKMVKEIKGKVREEGHRNSFTFTCFASYPKDKRFTLSRKSTQLKNVLLSSCSFFKSSIFFIKISMHCAQYFEIQK